MKKIHSIPPILAALLIQGVIYLFVSMTLPLISAKLGYEIPLFWVMIAQGLGAGAATFLLGFTYWWIIIQLISPPLLVFALALQIPLWVFPVLIIFLMMIFWNVAINRVPLYLTNRVTTEKIASLLPKKAGLKVVDLGSGLGGTIRRLALGRPEQLFFGYETAPIPFLLSVVLKAIGGNSNVTFFMKSFWTMDLGQYDVVYCFLSPVPMKDLYNKAAAEMKPGSLFISNSFAVPGRKPDRIVTVKDGRKTKLMVWKL